VKEYYTTGEVARVLNISAQTVKNYCDQGKIEADKSKLTHFRRVPRESLVQFMIANNLDLSLLGEDEKPTIMVVDDEELVRKFIRKVLERRKSFRVFEAQNGREGLDIMEKNPVDLLVLDLMMPVMDGPSMLAKVRERWPSLPVLIITAYADSQLMDQALEHGPFTLLRKPFDTPEMLVRTIQQLLGKVDNAAGATLTE